MKIKNLINGLIKDNPVFVQFLGMCPTLAVTTSAENAVGMGLATTLVLVSSNIAISLIKSVIPGKVRIPAYVIIISTFVTVVSMLMEAFMQPLFESLGLFLPLIVVNCIILARAESFASKNGVLDSMLDGIGMGLGFTFSLFILGSCREILGNGTFYGMSVLGSWYKPMLMMIFPPGAFLMLGLLLAGYNSYLIKRGAK